MAQGGTLPFVEEGRIDIGTWDPDGRYDPMCHPFQLVTVVGQYEGVPFWPSFRP